MEKQKILIVDDNSNFIESLRKTLKNFHPKDKELEILAAKNEQGAIVLLQENQDIKVMLLDYAMEHEDSGKRIFDFVRKRLKNETIQIIYLTGEVGNSDQRKIVDRDSPNDFINKNPWDSERVKTSIATRLDAYDKLISITAEANTALKEAEIYKSVARKEIEEKMGKGKAISKVFDQIEKYAKTDAPILLEGETGTGKELIANYLWKNSSREEMRILNCGSLSAELADSELFGYKKGAFTGADSDKIGLVKATDKGILFLDEINSLPLEVQVKLLRVIEYGTFIRKGDTEETKVDVRIIAAGNKSFQDLIEKGEFRDDLYERFNRKIYIPTLKERIEDIDHFIDYFLLNESNKQSKKVFISDEARKLLTKNEWERNVRQLKNTIANLVTEVELDKKSKTYIIQPELIKECLQEKGKRKNDVPDNDFSLQTAVDIATKKAILRALEKTSGHNEKAIELLIIARGTYYKEKDRLGIK